MLQPKRTYFSLELPDAGTALTIAKQIATRTSGPVTVADEDGNVIGTASPVISREVRKGRMISKSAK
jgi:hypothetical protein